MPTARSELRTRVEEEGRVGQNVDDSTLDGYLNKANKAFQRKARWLWRVVTLVIRDYFSMSTSSAFNLTVGSGVLAATDIKPSADQADVSGATLASALQSAIQACSGGSAITVSFSTSTRKFTLDGSGASAASWTVTYPASRDYYDARYMLFGTQDSASGATFVGNAAPYCTSKLRLPSDFIEVMEAVYDHKYGSPLKPEIYPGRNKSTGGTPKYYSLQPKDDYVYMRLTPQPTTIGKTVELAYFYDPVDIATGSGNDSTTYEYPARYDDALVNYAIYLYKKENNQMQEALFYLSLFRDMADQAQADRAKMLQGGAFDLYTRGRQGL